ncbi:g1489 [Coccomyxa viridis]|uniref:Translation initiation factor IF-3 n=1 Tax=Coccomyxa viridis TaxID=1274662 RepID=A0ABP1FI39_9CHLO
MLGALPNCSHCFSAPLTDRYGAQSLAFRPALRQQIASRHGLGRSSLLVVRCQRPPPSTRGGRGGGSSNYRGGGSSRGGGGGQSGGRGYQGTSTGGRGYQGSNPRGGGTSQPGRGGYQGRNFNPGYQGNRGGYQGRGRGGQLYQNQSPLDGKSDEQIEEQARADLAQRAERQKRARPESDVPINGEIEADQVRVVGLEKEMIGVMSLFEALDMADETDVDVVMINPQADPPVVRLVDYSKFRYEQSRAKKEASKRQREARQDLKELKFRPSTDVHDYQVRLRSAQKFIAKGDKVKLTITFKGREMQFQEIGRDLFKKFVDDLQLALEEEAKSQGKKEALVQATVQQDAKMQGNQMTLLLSPNINK